MKEIEDLKKVAVAELRNDKDNSKVEYALQKMTVQEHDEEDKLNKELRTTIKDIKGPAKKKQLPVRNSDELKYRSDSFQKDPDVALKLGTLKYE